MTNALGTLPNPTDFGTAFNYAAWTPNTLVRLCNVPWNNDYRDVVEFDDDAALNTYLNGVSGPSFTITRVTLARMGDPIRVNLPFNVVNQFNYLRVSNGTEPITAHYTDGSGDPQTVDDFIKTLYYFILEVRYIAPNTTEIVVQLDVWQTFRRNCTLGTAFIERGHVGIANENAMDHNGRDYLTIPEGFDLGNEYQNALIISQNLGDDGSNSWVMVGSTVDFTVDPGTVNEPNLYAAHGSNIDGLPQGMDIYFFTSVDDFHTVMEEFSATPWVTQGIAFMTVIPSMDDAVNYSDMPAFTDADLTLPSGTIVPRKIMQGAIAPKEVGLTDGPGWKSVFDSENIIPSRYSILDKFKTFPYTCIEVTTYTGQPIILKPELLPDNYIKLNLYRHLSPPATRWTMTPIDYNKLSGASFADKAEYFDMATHLTNFPKLTVLNDNYINYMASYRNRINFEFSSADWSQQRALRGADTAFDIASSSQQLNTDLNQIGMSQAFANTRLQQNMAGINALKGAVGDTAHAGVAGGPAALAASAIGNSIGGAMNYGAAIYESNAAVGIQTNAMNASTKAQNAQSAYVRDTNYQYASYAARGDYANTIAGINARVQDARMTQPSVVGQMDGESFMMTTADDGSGFEVHIKIKIPSQSAIYAIGDFWLRYGYAINRFVRFDDLPVKCMSKFTYWKMKELVFASAHVPEGFKQTMRGIFEKGVTLWNDPDDIGNIDISTNTPLTGVAY